MSNKTKEIKVMEDHGAWIFTEDQIQKIKLHNHKAIEKFFLDNQKLISNISKKFIYQQKNIYGYYNYLADDLINQIYIDLPYFRFDSRLSLYMSIIKSLKMIDIGGITASDNSYLTSRKIVSYDAPIKGNNKGGKELLILDTLSTTKSTEELLFETDFAREEKDKKIIEYLEKTMPNKKELNIMFVQLFTNIPLNEIKGDEYEQYIRNEF